MKNIKYIILLLILLSIFNVKTQAQDSTQLRKTQHSIAMRVGLQYIKEENLHPKTHMGLLVKLSYGFEKRKYNTSRFRTTIGYSRLKTKLEGVSKAVNFNWNTQYSRNYFIFQKNHLRYHLGLDATLAYSVSYFPNWDDSHLYWADYLSFGLSHSVTLQLKKKREWVTSFSFPLITIYSRPDQLRLYKIDDIDFEGIVKNLDGNPSLGFWNRAFPFQFETEYRFPVFNHKKEAFTYSFDFIRLRKKGENSFTQLSHQIGIKLGL